jgi:hypothetical protein
MFVRNDFEATRTEGVVCSPAAVIIIIIIIIILNCKWGFTRRLWYYSKTTHLNKIHHMKLYKQKQRKIRAWVRERTIPTEVPPLGGEVSANVCW